MDNMASTTVRFLADESGVTAIEYALIGTLIVVGAIAGFGAFGTSLGALYEDWIAAAIQAINSRL